MIADRDPWFFQRWAFETKTGSSGRKAVLMALATMGDQFTGRCEAKVSTLAKITEISDRSVRQHLTALTDAGIIDRRPQHRADGGRRGDEYLLLAPGITEWPDGTPHANLAGGPSPLSGEAPSPSAAAQERPPRNAPSEERPEGPAEEDDGLSSVSGRERASAGASNPGTDVAEPVIPEWRYGPRAVPLWARKRALAAFAVYVQVSGSEIKPFRPSTGAPSEALRLITGAVLDHKEIQGADWAEIVRRCFDRPWWDGPPSVGVVFGPKVIEKSVALLSRDDFPERPRKESFSDLWDLLQ